MKEIIYKMVSNRKVMPLVLVLLVLILILLILIVVLLTFSNKNNSVEPTTNEVKTITFWTREGYIDKSVLDQIISQFETENPNIKVIHEFQSDTNYKEKIISRLEKNTGELADIIEIEERWIDSVYRYVTPITDPEVKTRYSPVIVANNSVSSQMYAVPFQFNSILLAYNVEELSKQGLDESYLNSLDWTNLAQKAKELTSTMKVKTQNNRETDKVVISGIAIGSPKSVPNAREILKLLIIQNNVQFYDSSSQKYIYDNRIQDVMDFYFNFSSKNVWDNSLGRDTEAFAQGKTLMMFAKSEDIDDIKRLNPNINFKVTLTPKISIMKGVSLSKSLIIPQRSKYYQESMKFIDYLTETENLLKLFEAKSKYTFVPAQLEALNSIPKESIFSSFSDVYTVSQRIKCHDEDELNELVENFLLSVYSSAESSNSTEFRVNYNSKSLVDSLNRSVESRKKKV